MTKTTVIFTQENGEPKIEVKNAKGSQCLEITKDLEKAIGKVETRKKTKDFYNKNITTIRNLDRI